MTEPVHRHVQVDGAELDVLVGGRAESGDATVCTAHPTESMDQALGLLADITQARVVCVNPRGVGGSSPPAEPADSTLEGMADDLEAVRLALGVHRWVIWGMSGGSMIAQVFAHRHPHALEGLILDSAGPCLSMALRDAGCAMSPFFPRWRDGLTAAGLSADPDAGLERADTIWEPLPKLGWVLRRAAGPVVLVAPSEPSPQMRRVMPSLLAFDARAWLSAIRVPTLVLGGAADEVAPLSHLHTLHEAIPASTFIAIEGAGHVPIMEKPAEVGAAVRSFLSRRVWA